MHKNCKIDLCPKHTQKKINVRVLVSFVFFVFCIEVKIDGLGDRYSLPRASIESLVSLRCKQGPPSSFPMPDYRKKGECKFTIEEEEIDLGRITWI